MSDVPTPSATHPAVPRPNLDLHVTGHRDALSKCLQLPAAITILPPTYHQVTLERSASVARNHSQGASFLLGFLKGKSNRGRYSKAPVSHPVPLPQTPLHASPRDLPGHTGSPALHRENDESPLTWAPGGTEAAAKPLQVLTPLPRTDCSIEPLGTSVKGEGIRPREDAAR